MESNTILKQFREKVSEKIILKEKGIGRYIVQTPFVFDDGDHLVIILKHEGKDKKWRLTDEGHTFMHLGYFMEIKDTQKGTRQDIIKGAKKMFGIQEKEGELYLFIKEDKFGDALFDFIQSLLKIMDITFLGRERVASTFFEDFRKSLTNITKKLKNKMKLEVEFNCYIPKDKRKAYPIDACIKTEKEELFVFAIHNDNRCLNSAFSIVMFERMGIKFNPVGIFDDQTEISRSILAKFSDVCGKQISSLDNIERFEKFLESH